MLNRKSASYFSLVGCIALVLALAVFFSCSEQPTSLDTNESGDLTGKGTIDPAAAGRFLLGTVSDTVVAPGYIEVWAMNVAFDSSQGVVSFDVRLLNRTGRNIAPPVRFVITSIVPRDIALLGFDGQSPDGFPFFDFGSKLGADNVLTPGESTDPVTLRFHTVTPRSFAIGFRIDLRGTAGPGIIAGVVYLDRDKDGVRDCRETDGMDDPGDRDDDSLWCEPGVAGITVALEKPLAGGDVVTLITQTDLHGAYSFGALAEGVYKVFVAAPVDQWEITSTNPLLVTLVEGPDGSVQSFLRANFGLFPLMPVNPENLFGPVLVGPFSDAGEMLYSHFASWPSQLPIIYHYYLEVTEPDFEGPFPAVVDSAFAIINDEWVFSYTREFPPDSAYFGSRLIELPQGLVRWGSDNYIRLFTSGNEYAALLWRVYRIPGIRTP